MARSLSLTADLNCRQQLVIEEQLGMLLHTQLKRRASCEPGQFQAQVSHSFLPTNLPRESRISLTFNMDFSLLSTEAFFDVGDEKITLVAPVTI
jgi:hypothetical protein